MAGRPRLAVLGSLNTDISVAVPRLPAPGETMLGSDAVIAPGGKGANQAVAAARLGAAVLMAGCTGADDFGAALTAALAAEGVDVSAVRAVAGYATGMALITVDAAGENVITVAPGANGQAGAIEVDAAVAGQRDLLIMSAEIPLATLRMALAAARRAGTASLLNLAPAPAEAAGLLSEGVDWLVVNEPEAATILGRPVTGLAAAQAAAADLRGLGACNAVVTAGPEGAAVASGRRRCVRCGARRDPGGGNPRRGGRTGGMCGGRRRHDAPRYPGRAAPARRHSRGDRRSLAAAPGLSRIRGYRGTRPRACLATVRGPAWPPSRACLARARVRAGTPMTSRTMIVTTFQRYLLTSRHDHRDRTAAAGARAGVQVAPEQPAARDGGSAWCGSAPGD
jgi:ribokinase